MFILYLVISSFSLSICETNKDDDNDDNIIINISAKVLEQIKKYAPNIEKIGMALFADDYITRVNNFLVTIGKGISHAVGSLYSALLDTCGVGVTGLFVAGTTVIILAGTGVIIYKIYNTKYVKVAEFEYSSLENENNSRNKKK